LYHYCIIRADLPLGAKLAQLIHAAGESSPGNLPPETHAIALEAADEAALLKLESRLQQAGIPHTSIRELDAPYLGALMAIGLPPQPRSRLIRKYLSQYKLAA